MSFGLCASPSSEPNVLVVYTARWRKKLLAPLLLLIFISGNVLSDG